MADPSLKHLQSLLSDPVARMKLLSLYQKHVGTTVEGSDDDDDDDADVVVHEHGVEIKSDPLHDAIAASRAAVGPFKKRVDTDTPLDVFYDGPLLPLSKDAANALKNGLTGSSRKREVDSWKPKGKGKKVVVISHEPEPEDDDEDPLDHEGDDEDEEEDLTPKPVIIVPVSSIRKKRGARSPGDAPSGFPQFL